MMQVPKSKVSLNFLSLFICLFSIFTSTRAQSYIKLHKKAIICDTHNDIISTAIEKGYNFDNDLKGLTHTDISRLEKGGVDVQVFSVFCDGKQSNPYEFANREIDTLDAWIARNNRRMVKVTSPRQLKRAVRDGKIASMIGVEGGHMIEDDLTNLQNLAGRGARYMTLTWNNSNSWATSAMDETDSSDKLVHKGLTDFGKKVIATMNDLGVMVDVSHVGEQTFWDVMETTSKPVIASHSDVYTIAPVFRNLKDDQIKAIAKNGGVIHLNFYAGFLDSNFLPKAKEFFKRHKVEKDSLLKSGKDDWEANSNLYAAHADEVAEIRPPLSVLFDHIDYIVRLVGEDYVGLGSDFDGINFAPNGLDDVTSYPLITKGLLERGYSKKSIKKILGRNFIRAFKANSVKK